MEWIDLPEEKRFKKGDIVYVEDGEQSGLWLVSEDYFVDAPFKGKGELSYLCKPYCPFPQWNLIRTEKQSVNGIKFALMFPDDVNKISLFYRN